MKITVLDGYTLNPGDLSWEPLKQYGELSVYDRTSKSETVIRAADSEILLTNKTVLDSETIKQLPQLKYIGILATGTNVVDMEAATQAGITVTNIPAYSTPSVAQLTFALILELCHQTAKHSKSVHAGEWSSNQDFCYQLSPLVELSGKTMGIVGFGQIGQECAKIASAFGMKILFTARNQKEIPHGMDAKQTDLETLLQSSDVVSLNCPLTPQTENLICKETLSLMKKSALLINTGRGPLVNEADLANALQNSQIAGYGADVLSTEPPQTDNPLIGTPHAVITPHIAWKTLEARSRLMETAISNVKAFVSGKIINQVN